MSNKKQKKTSLKSSILLLLLMALLLVASSYAWFTANQTVTISQLQVKVEAANGLQISADAQNWKTVLDINDLKEAAETYDVLVNQLPVPTNDNQSISIEPVSTAGNVVDGKMEMFYGEVTADDSGTYYLSATKQTEATGTSGKFIAFDLFLKVDELTTVYLTTGTNVVFDGSDKGLKNAARIAFVKEATVSAETDPETMRASSSASGKADILEPNCDVHTANGVTSARDIYSTTTTLTNAAPLDYYGIINAIPAETITMKQTITENPSVEYFEKVLPKWKIPTAGQQVTFDNLAAGVTKVRVYMWIEGQDVDCENMASGTNVNFNVQFSKASA